MDRDLSSTTSSVAQLNAQLAGLTNLLESQVGKALDNVVTRGKSFEDVLGMIRGNLLQVVAQLGIVNPLLNGLFGSSRTTIADTGGGAIGSLLGSATGALSDLFGSAFGGSAPTSAASASSTTPVTVNIQTANAQSFAASSGQVSAGIAEAVRRGQTLM